MKFTNIVTDDSATVVVGNKVFTIAATSPNFDEVCNLVNDPTTTPDRMIAACSPATWLATRTVNHGSILVENGQVFHNGTAVHNVLTERILKIAAEGADIEAWVKFTDKVFANPYEWAREELYLWLANNNLPITPEGNFVAYKKVRNDYLDIHTGSMDNSPGQWVVMPGGREAVDKRRAKTCSTGLHFCSKEYLPSFGTGPGNRVVLVEIDPSDVVSIPHDYNNAKGRCWRYKVVGEIPEAEAQTMIWPAVANIRPVFVDDDDNDIDWEDDNHYDNDNEYWDWHESTYMADGPVDPAPVEINNGAVTSGIKTMIQRFIRKQR